MSHKKTSGRWWYDAGMSSTPTAAQTQLEQTITEPKRARDAAIEVEQRSVGELIEADKHLRRTSAASSPFGAIKKGQLRFGRPGGLP